MTFKLNKNGNYFVLDSKVNHLSEFIAAVDKAEDLLDKEATADVWFRGHSQQSFKLIPSIFRNTNRYEPTYEYSEITQFIHKARAFTNGEKEHDNMWDWLITAQHHGMSTRLLDWSEGALIALYFSIENPNSISPCVWVLNPYRLNFESRGREIIYHTDNVTKDDEDTQTLDEYKVGSSALPTTPIAITPPYIDIRLKAQKGCFTLHGKNKTSIHSLSKNAEKPFLARIDISKSAINRIRWQLDVIGINTSDIYPDLSGLAKEIMWQNL